MNRTWISWGGSLAIHLAILAGLGVLYSAPPTRTQRIDLAFLQTDLSTKQTSSETTETFSERPQVKPVKKTAKKNRVPVRKPETAVVSTPRPKKKPQPEPAPSPVATFRETAPDLPAPNAPAITTNRQKKTATQAENPGETEQAVGPSDVKRYISAHLPGIRQRVISELRYPLIARRQGWHGQVRLEFTVLTSGKIRDLRIVASSGHSVLDQQALRAVRLAAPFPVPPESATVTLPVTFELN